MAFNDRRDPRQCPEFVAEAMGASALAEEVNELLPLVGCEFGVTPAGRGVGVEPGFRMVDKGSAPPADGTGGGGDVPGHLTDAPAGLQQRDGHPASDFELGFRAFGSHGDLSGEIELSL